MKFLLYTIFIALANNVDNIGARIAYSIRGIKITTVINLWISVITFVISALAAFSGTAMSDLFSKRLSSVVSMVLLTAIGVWMIVDPYIRRRRALVKEPDEARRNNILNVFLNPEHADRDNSKHIDFKEATVLGIALSINNIGGGLGAGMIGLNSWLVGLFSAIISFLALWAGNYVTEFFVKWKLGNAATVTAGFILIAIGVEQLL
jgi:putative sporulation protein YtaF